MRDHSVEPAKEIAVEHGGQSIGARRSEGGEAARRARPRAAARSPFGRRWAAAGGAAFALAFGHPAAAEPAAPASVDSWWGSDKALHFGFAAGLAAGGYAAGTALWSPPRWRAAALGGGVAIGLGAAKEGWDALGHGDPSWKDFTWDVIGAVFGLAAAYAIDWAVRGEGPPPLASAAIGSSRAGLMVRF